MKMTVAQQENIREVLWNRLKYRETFDELYDHILTAIEEDEDDTPPHLIADTIIKQEFGGWDNIKELEKGREKNVQSQFRNALWVEVKSYFRVPFIAFTLLVAVSFYFSADYISRKLLMLILFTAVMMPAVMWYRIAPCNRWSRKYKASVKESSANNLGTLGISLFNMLIFLPALFSKQQNYKFMLQAHASLVAVAAAILIIYSVSAVKVFQQNLKTSLVS
ncbi:hypothetical protein [Mucilaginibacter sp. PAMB04168]|uniref:hypothetical protein n=1 Tax=Mucilaginibacter sp. PAMB04168 TaxID=3138567 RepID=UPI0031F69511